MRIKDTAYIMQPSACLTKQQLNAYVLNVLEPEELNAVEFHLCSCWFCYDAAHALKQFKMDWSAHLDLDKQFIDEHLKMQNEIIADQEVPVVINKTVKNTRSNWTGLLFFLLLVSWLFILYLLNNTYHFY
ncbi:MAG: hypothetical protein KGN97_01545 [Bacteroidota bacterium]|jgi:hypothetical protein|nr:hypothetical protein [Bacteroidota bacterium]